MKSADFYLYNFLEWMRNGKVAGKLQLKNSAKSVKFVKF
ncbi:hypothetical protein M2451_003562 [Dysgonomonas sp. PFB1-18]|nr:hypothetical protein [Dysgonomonas sp. PF1-14]MDH6340672.1 hypothetical protein [Dysgonomonas sp. PF1-16]MDH6382221.1 hypothetical protein [Dysgonomonas sp. PFB1-18]MDH6399642.1 hypothetical protein [Dysgonomonas sp. PF1-23]